MMCGVCVCMTCVCVLDMMCLCDVYDVLMC